jgi:hypothetical protein
VETEVLAVTEKLEPPGSLKLTAAEEEMAGPTIRVAQEHPVEREQPR